MIFVTALERTWEITVLNSISALLIVLPCGAIFGVLKVVYFLDTCFLISFGARPVSQLSPSSLLCVDLELIRELSSFDCLLLCFIKTLALNFAFEPVVK